LYYPDRTCNTWTVKIVSRRQADIRISLKKRGGATYRIGLIRQPAGKRYWVRHDGKYSTEIPEATATELAQRIRRRLVANG
jgi:hypothetical protein